MVKRQGYDEVVGDIGESESRKQNIGTGEWTQKVCVEKYVAGIKDHTDHDVDGKAEYIL